MAGESFGISLFEKMKGKKIFLFLYGSNRGLDCHLSNVEPSIPTLEFESLSVVTTIFLMLNQASQHRSLNPSLWLRLYFIIPL